MSNHFVAPTRREFIRTSTATLGVLASRTAWAQTSAVPPLTARVRLNPEHRLGTIDSRLYGNFIEHLGRCIYGGLYDEGSPLADADGIRTDVLAATRALGVTLLRWPGGNFVSGYHWQDGIGPKDARPARYDRAWFQRESNRFGTDEFFNAVGKMGARPYLCVNLGTGTPEEAANWLEYCNYPGGTYFSDLRKKNGHAAPYGVKLWGLGNEMFGSWQIGHRDAGGYGQLALETAKLMKWQDPTIELVASGASNPDWDRPMLELLGPQVDYLSSHYYTVTDDLKDDYEILGSVAAMEHSLRSAEESAALASARARRKTPIYIACDEWNLLNNWSDGGKRDDPHKFEVPYNMRDALWVASALSLLQRHCATVRVANFAQLVNDLAPMFTTPTGLLLRTTYHPLALFARRSGPIALAVAQDSPGFATKRFEQQPYLDASATYDEDKRKVTVALVNRRLDGPVNAQIHLNGYRAIAGGKHVLLTGATPATQNTFENPNAVAPRETTLSAAGTAWEQTLPPHSLTWLEFEVAKV